MPPILPHPTPNDNRSPPLFAHLEPIQAKTGSLLPMIPVTSCRRPLRKSPNSAKPNVGRLPPKPPLFPFQTHGIKKLHHFWWSSLCSHSPSSWVGQVLSFRKKHAGGMFSERKKPPTFVGGLMFALPIFLGRPSIVLPSASVRWTLAGRKNPDLSIGAYVRVTYLPRQSPAKYCRRT